MSEDKNQADWDESEIVRHLRLELSGTLSVTQDRALNAAVVALACQEERLACNSEEPKPCCLRAAEDMRERCLAAVRAAPMHWSEEITRDMSANTIRSLAPTARANAIIADGNRHPLPLADPAASEDELRAEFEKFIAVPETVFYTDNPRDVMFLVYKAGYRLAHKEPRNG